MSMRLVPEGSVIERTYLAVPGHSSIGTEFDNTEEGWDEAVTFAQKKKSDLVSKLTELQGAWSTPEQIEETANVQVRVDLRWKISDPVRGGGLDTIVESYRDVDRLRKTRATA